MKSTRNFFLRGLFFGCLLTLFCTPAVSAESITIAGTGDSQHMLREIAQAFHQENPDLQVLVPNSVGSGGGIKLLLAGRSELARVARPLKPKEQAEGLTQRIFAYSPIVFVAHLPAPCLDNITTQQYLDILSGKINNWAQLGNCTANNIYIANREDGDSSREVLEREIPAMSSIENPEGRTIYSTPETYDTLNRYLFSFGYLPRSQVHKGNLTILNYNGLSPTTDNIQQGHYKLVVPLAVAWHGTPNGATKKFIDFLFSPKVKQLITTLGAVPGKAE